MIAAILTPLLIFSAFILLLLISLSVPIIKTIYLFSLSTNVSSGFFDSGVSGAARFGVWGYCVGAIQVSVAGFDRSSEAECTQPKLGYTFDENLAEALQVEEYTDLISRTTAAAFVLHPIACGLAFVTLLVSLFMLRRGSNGTSRLPSFLTLGLGLLTATLTTVAFLIDVIVVAIIRNKVRDKTDGVLVMNWGNAVWMALGATVALWIAMLGACAGICACGGRRKRNASKY